MQVATHKKVGRRKVIGGREIVDPGASGETDWVTSPASRSRRPVLTPNCGSPATIMWPARPAGAENTKEPLS